MKTRICPQCSSFMNPHHSLRGWNSCSCGYCKEIKYMNNKITLESYLMGRDKLYPTEYNDEIKNNALKLLAAVNSFFESLKYEQPLIISSGWRPSAINSQLANAAKKSLHMSGLAVDIKDPDGKLYALVCTHAELLRKYALFLEDGASTKGWVHLDISPTRADRPSRIFKP